MVCFLFPVGPVPHTPPPLPPRRRRDSTPLAPQPSPTASQVKNTPTHYIIVKAR